MPQVEGETAPPPGASDELVARRADLFQGPAARGLRQNRHVGRSTVPGRVLDAVEHLAQAFAPAAAHHAEIRILLVDADDLVGGQASGLVHHQVQRQPDREVGLERAVHGHQRALGGLVQWRVGREHAVQHRLAVLGLAHLEIGRLGRGLDEIAGRVHLEEPHALALDLAAEHHRHVEIHPRSLQRRAVALVHVPHGRAQYAGGVEHAPGVPDGDGIAAVAVHQLFGLQDFPHRLGDAQVAGREQHHEAVTRTLVDHHLAEGADLVEAGVGAGIGQEDQSGIELDGDAVRHGGTVGEKAKGPSVVGSALPGTGPVNRRTC